MALFDIFKKKKKIKKREKIERGEEIKKEVKKETKEAKEIKAKKPKRPSETAYRILKNPHITEKATDLANKNQYVFEVFSGANKVEIKKAIEDLYGVKVISVRIISIPPKTRRLGMIEGERKGYKKAIVRIAEGQKIEVLPR